jgi:hypothetical protein
MTTNDDTHLNDDELRAAAEGESLPEGLQRHADSCALCASQIAAAQQTFSLLRGTPEPSLSHRLRRDLLQTYRSKRLRRRPMRRLLSLRIPVYQAACLMAGAILAWELVTPRPEASQHREELLKELPGFTAAMTEFGGTEYGVDAWAGIAPRSKPSNGTPPNVAKLKQETIRWERPSGEDTPGVDSCAWKGATP